jgi:hypothetical protein
VDAPQKGAKSGPKAVANVGYAAFWQKMTAV